MSETRSHRAGRGSLGGDFAEALTTLIHSHDSSARALAEALGIDVSLVYKWLRRERTPALTSEYPDAIARFLGLDTSEQVALRAAQERSLRHGRLKQPVPRRVASVVARIVTREVAPARSLGEAGRKTPGLAPDVSVLHTAEAVQQAILNVLGSSRKPEGSNNTILCTFQGQEQGAFDSAQRLTWWDAMQRALRSGWRIDHVWRLGRDIERSIYLVASTLDLLGAGDYRPFYIDGSEALSPPYELVIRPDVAVVMLATSNAQNVDSAIVTRDPEQIRLWREHCLQLRALAKPPLERFLPAQNVTFGEMLTKSEETLPGRSFVKYGLSLFTEPASWARPDSHWAQLIRRQGFDVARYMEFRKRRLAAFQRNVRTATYRDICPEQAVEAMAKTGLYLANGKRSPEVQVPARERREHLANTIRTLREHENYQLALVPDDALPSVRISPDTFWEVLGGSLALLNTPICDGHAGAEAAAAMDVVIKEPRIAAAFQHYFDTLWERISPLNRDKRYVTWWLERLLESVPNEPSRSS